MLLWVKEKIFKKTKVAIQLTGCDVYRDGGSCSVSFVDEKGVECAMMFPIKVVGLSKTGLETDGHLPPVLTRYVQVKVSVM